jgi:hypothetical protein
LSSFLLTIWSGSSSPIIVGITMSLVSFIFSAISSKSAFSQSSTASSDSSLVYSFYFSTFFASILGVSFSLIYVSSS